MISNERSKYKSWSNLKRQMNDLLCDSLKNKISYFYTSYHEVHSAYGRATINYNKKELVAFSWDIGYAKWDDEYTVLNQNDVSIKTLGSFQAVWEEQKRVQEELNKSKWMPEGKLCETDFINAVTTYLKTDIAAALHSDNYLLRVFAYMDRRVGKRTLVKIKDEVEKLPDWVKQFYQIRCEADGIVFPPKRMTDESIVCLSKLADTHIETEIDPEELDTITAKVSPTYPEIKAYVLEHHGLKASSLAIAQTKKKCGLEVGECYDLPSGHGRPPTNLTPEREAVIREAFQYYGLI